jgi:hypothetical protein
LFSYPNGLKQGDAVSPLLFNFALKYAIRKVQENEAGLKLNGRHLILSYGNDVDLLGNDTEIIKRNTETLIDASKEVGLEVNVEKTRYMLASHHWCAGQAWDIKIANRSLENMSELKNVGMTVTNQNLIQEEIKWRQNSGDAF